MREAQEARAKRDGTAKGLAYTGYLSVCLSIYLSIYLSVHGWLHLRVEGGSDSSSGVADEVGALREPGVHDHRRVRDALVDVQGAGDAVGPKLGVVGLGLGAEHVTLCGGNERRRNVAEAFVRVEERAGLRVGERGAGVREVDLAVPHHLGGRQLRGERVLRPRGLGLACGGVVCDGDDHQLEPDGRKPAGERRRSVAVTHDRGQVASGR